MKKDKKEKNIDKTDLDMHNSDVNDDLIIESEEGTFASDSIKKLRNKLKACEEQKKEYLDGWQRCKAEFVNTKKRDNESRIASIDLAKENILISLLPVLDSFEMAFLNAESIEKIDKNWIIGMQNLQVQLINILKEHGINVINPIGEQFNPNKHDSVETIEAKSKNEDGKIVKVIQKGYEINGKIIRVSKVLVAHKK